MICVTINGFCYWASQRILEIQSATKPHRGSKEVVTFDVGFYLISAAGAISVIGASCNCLKRYPSRSNEHTEHLLDDYDGADFQPPPAYAP